MAWVDRSKGLEIPVNRWWVAPGMSNNDALVAYQPIGSPTLASSYINRANPGVNDASPVVAPVFATATGWTFAAAEHLSSGITGDGSQSIMVRFTLEVLGARASISGYDTGIKQQYIEVETVGASKRFYRGYNASEANSLEGPTLSRVACLSRNEFYLDGVSQGTVGSLDTWSEGTITIANDITATSAKFTGVIQAYAIYERSLTFSEIAVITTQMNALTGSDDPTPTTDSINWIVQNPRTKFLNNTSHELWLAGGAHIYRTLNGGRSYIIVPLPDPSNAEFGDSPAATVDELSWHWIDYSPTKADPLTDEDTLIALASKASVNRQWLYKSTDTGQTWISRGIVTA